MTVSRYRIAAAAFVAVAASLLLLASGCGGSKKSSSATTGATTTTSAGAGTVSTADWANGFCSALDSWVTSIKSQGQMVRAHPTKANVQGLVATVKNANHTLVASLKSLGTPNTAGGAQAKAAVDSLATSLKSHSDQINSAIKSMSGAAELRTTVTTLATNLTAMRDAFKSAQSRLNSLSKSEKGSFKQAFSQASACQKLKAQGA